MIHHVEINVSDLKKTRDFWDWFLTDLNYEIYQEWEKGISWKFENTYLVFVQTEERFIQNRYHRSQTGLNHLAFFAHSKDHVDQMVSKLSARGVPLLYQDRYPFAGGKNYYALFCEDPDRIKVELVAPEGSV